MLQMNPERQKQRLPSLAGRIKASRMLIWQDEQRYSLYFSLAAN